MTTPDPLLTQNVIRRSFLLVSAAYLSGIVRPDIADAQEELLESDLDAIALNYKRDAETVPSEVRPEGPGTACYNCSHFDGAEFGEIGFCRTFPRKMVSIKGWCEAHTPEA